MTAIMTVSELKLKLKSAQLIEQQQANMPSDEYVATLHYHAINMVKKIKYVLLNHPDLSNDDYSRLINDSAYLKTQSQTVQLPDFI